MSAIDTLLNRNSHARLVDPGPDAGELNTILQAASRAPDHGRLRPWRFVVVAGDRRQALGEVFMKSLRLRGIDDPAKLEKATNAPLRAPLIIVGLLHAVAHPKIAREEQAHAVAAALAAAQLAAESLGIGSMWRTGGYATDPTVIKSLGGAVDDQVIGFLYLGTREGPRKMVPIEPLETFVSHF